MAGIISSAKQPSYLDPNNTNVAQLQNGAFPTAGWDNKAAKQDNYYLDQTNPGGSQARVDAVAANAKYDSNSWMKVNPFTASYSEADRQALGNGNATPALLQKFSRDQDAWSSQQSQNINGQYRGLTQASTFDNKTGLPINGYTSQNGKLVFPDGSTSEERPQGPNVQGAQITSPGSYQGGIIANAGYPAGGVAGLNPNASGANPVIGANGTATYNPTTLSAPKEWQVTPDQTVQGQIEKIINPNNPIIMQARAQALQNANARGLANSSIAESGADNAVYSTALPIAQADAAAYLKAQGYNADTTNQFAVNNQNAENTGGQFNAGQTNQMSAAQLSADTNRYATDVGASTSLANTASNNATSRYTADVSSDTSKYNTNANNSTQLATANLSATTQKYLSDQSASTQLAVSKLSAENQAAVSAAHDQNSVLLQNSTAAQNAFANYLTAVANVDLQTTMNEDAKRAAITTLTQTYNAQIDAIKKSTPNAAAAGSPLDVTMTPAVQQAVQQVGGVDVSGQLNFSKSDGS